MSFLKNVGSTASDAAKTAVKKTEELIEVVKIKIKISESEDAIKKIFTEIGSLYYEGYDPDVVSPYAEQIEKIGAQKDKLIDLNKKLNEIKGVTVCGDCGKECQAGHKFCPYCGNIISAAKEEPEANGQE